MGQEEFQEIFNFAHAFGGPEVGVVGDNAVTIWGLTLPLHHPFEGGFSVDDVFAGFQGSVPDLAGSCQSSS